MSGRYGNKKDPFAGLCIPSEVLVILRRRLAAIEQSDDTLQVYLANGRAQGVIETLEVLKELKQAEIESLYLIMDDAAQARVTVLLL